MTDIQQLFPFLEPGSSIKLQNLVQFIIVGMLCAGVLALVYRRISPVKTDENEFAATLFILTISIGLLVSIIKHAPAISFGLFGAMSIVRFRTQIKKPRRMVFLFMATAIGVCCGAGEFLVTIAGTVMLCSVALLVFQRTTVPEADDEVEPAPADAADEKPIKAVRPVAEPESSPIPLPAKAAALAATSASLTDGPMSKNVQVYPGGRKHRRR